MGRNSNRDISRAQNFKKRKVDDLAGILTTEYASVHEDDTVDNSCQTDILTAEISCQTNTVSYRNFSTQVNFDNGTNDNRSNYSKNIDPILTLQLVSCLCDLLRNQFEDQWNSVSERIFSVIIYNLLKNCGIKYKDIQNILIDFNSAAIETAHRWSLTIADEDNSFAILRDKRGGFQKEGFYEEFPEIEEAARLYAIKECGKKSTHFCVDDLVKFITLEYQEVTNDILPEGEYIRSKFSCRADLIRWGAKFEKNTKRPYFDGHERADVVESRKQFVDYFLGISKYVFQQSSDALASWIAPLEHLYIIMCHDQSTFRSGEQRSSRWMFNKSAVFYNKGQGKSMMLSYFLLQHEEGIFELNEVEWQAAVKDNPFLLDKHSFVNFEPRSANAWIEPGKDRYFNNEIVLEQFERLFILLKYKKIFKNKKIVLIVDNATTHKAKKYDVNLLNKSPDTNCPYKTLEWAENGVKKVLNCFDSNGISKGLFAICKELGLISSQLKSSEILLKDLRELALKHEVFSSKSNLELLAEKYDVILKFCPKFHCELNPIESLWCQMKAHVRKFTDQTFKKMQSLIQESKSVFNQNKTNQKIWRRFWQALNMYKQPNLTYYDIIVLLYGARTSKNLSKRVIYNKTL